MKRREYFMRRMAQDISAIPARVSREEVEQLKKEYPDLEVMTPPGCIRLAPMYTKTDSRGSKPGQER